MIRDIAQEAARARLRDLLPRNPAHHHRCSMSEHGEFTDEDEVHEWLAYRGLTHHEAIEALMSCFGYKLDDARQIASEWADDLESGDYGEWSKA